MQIFGVDFTSRPTRRKPITCVSARLIDRRLVFESLAEWVSFGEFEDWLTTPGPWVAGLDFPFGQARRFIENIGWPQPWAAYIDYVGALSRPAFREELDGYRAGRPAGDKEHRRVTDIRCGAVSSQKLYGVPVGLMFYEGAPRLRASGVHVPLLEDGDQQRTALEAYPGALARGLIGRRPYKQDVRQKQSAEQAAARLDILAALSGGGEELGFTVDAPAALADDPQGDHLDALLCCVQAAWAYRQAGWGIPADADALEGWIAGPMLVR